MFLLIRPGISLPFEADSLLSAVGLTKQRSLVALLLAGGLCVSTLVIVMPAEIMGIPVASSGIYSSVLCWVSNHTASERFILLQTE